MDDLRMELRALAYVALMTNRSLIVPNLLIGNVFLMSCDIINSCTSIGTGSGIRGKDRTRASCVSKGDMLCDTTLPEAPDAWAESEPIISRKLLARNISDQYDNVDYSEDLITIDDYEFMEYLSSNENYRDNLHRQLAETRKQKKKGPRRKGGVYDILTPYHDQSHTAQNRHEF